MGTSITEHYQINRPVPFADLDVDCDNRKVLDAHAIRLAAGPLPYAQDALHCFDTFFDTISRGAMSSNAVARDHAEDLLKHFEEPWENRLGMAEEGFAGHGGADDVGGWIWDAMCTDLDALLRVGVLKRLEELPLFVEGVGYDITSDITTRIGFGALADFTADMLQQFPEFTAASHKVKDFQRQVWDPTNRVWAQKTVTLPLIDGKPLLLMPANWVRNNLLMHAGRFYETTVLSYAQAEQAVVAGGKVIKTPKDRLKTQQGLRRGRETIRVVTLRAESAGDDLVDIFGRFVASRYSQAA
ncbi:hypothetical protein ACFRJ9_21590 [Paenarthrobacter sp. NPDC056912]|uniref:hypothetical protein n=1 Tax=Paenarthrobacter sp. NPDC056912 TaxID=3345965 RepID=UPI00366B82B5